MENRDEGHAPVHPYNRFYQPIVSSHPIHVIITPPTHLYSTIRAGFAYNYHFEEHEMVGQTK
jgi:hypothetical protein